MSALIPLPSRLGRTLVLTRGSSGFLLLLLGVIGSSARANPTGGSITTGAGSIAGQGTSYVTVNQSSARAIINWQSFSVGQNETTQFIQPSASSIALNRVLGGSISQIDGSILANGQIILINQNGIVIGPTGTINTASFLASTRDIQDTDFTRGSLHFTGSNANGVTNQGTISALGGNVILLGKTVSNSGTINAPGGLTSLDAADDLTLSQNDLSGSTVTVTASSQATAAPSSTGVNNSGTITAVQAELRAVNGNLYALAINNGGVIRATTLKHQGGRILLTADGGKVVNAGTLDAGATVAGGTGGQVDLLNKQGLAANTGAILARGGVGGAGGQGEISGKTLDFSGTTDFRAPGGKLGSLLLDPAVLIIDSSANTPADVFIDPISDGANSQGGAQETGYITTESIVSALQNSNLTLSAASSITLNDPITSTGSGSLAFALYNDVNATNPTPLTLNLNAAITLGSGATLSGTNVGTVNVGVNGLVQNGIDAASAGATVNLAATTYALNSQLLINKSLTLNGSGANTILDGQSKTRVLEIDGTTDGDAVNLNNLTLTNGNGVGLNNSGNGGGLLIYAESASSNFIDVSISNSTVSNNTARNGGGIFNDGSTPGSSASLGLMNSTVTNNTSQGNAGGIFNYGENGRATATITNTTISFNSGQYGGGIMNAGATGVSNLSITNSTIANNTASLGGGAVYNSGNSLASAIVSVSNSTISGNSASYVGGGIDNSGGALAIGDTILAGNTNAGSESDYTSDGTGTLTDNGYNLYGQNGANGGFPGGGTGDILLAGPISSVFRTVDGVPALDNYGGATQTFALAANSPAINAGGQLTGYTTPTTDQRGDTRGNPIDIGAYDTDTTPPQQTVDNLIIDAMNPTTLAADTEYLTTAMVENDLLTNDLTLSANLTITLNDPLTSRGTGNLTFAAAGTPAITLNLNAPITFTGSGALRSGTNVGTVNVGNNGLVQNGIDAASAGATVNLAAATYALNAQLLINKNLTLSGSGANTILDGQNQTRVLEIDGTADGDAVNLSNLTLTHGNGVGTNGAGSSDSGSGGGLLVYADNGLGATVSLQNLIVSQNDLGATVSPQNLIVSQNTAATTGPTGIPRGGGIDSEGGTLSLESSTISGNTAEADGGGISGDGSVVTLTNSTVSNNTGLDGGGISSHGSIVTLNNSNITGNKATYDGGGIYSDSSIGSATLALNNTTVSGNMSSQGGGIDNEESSATLTSSTVSGNTASGSGGGIFSNGYGGLASLTLNASTVLDNTANNGGGIYNNAASGSATLTINGSSVSGNMAQGYRGGGIYNDGSGGGTARLALNNSTVSGNSAGSYGGGIYNLGSGGNALLTVESSTLANNTASAQGGAIINDSGPNRAELSIDNSTLTGNSSGFGGAIYIYNEGGTNSVAISSSTIAGNSAGSSGGSGGIFNSGGTLAIGNTILAGNNATGSESDYAGGNVTDLGYNLYGQGGADGGFPGGGTGDTLLTGPISSVLQTVDGVPALESNGGPTQTIALVTGSPALGAGGTSGPYTDQRGMTRGSPIDIGAYDDGLSTQPTQPTSPTNPYNNNPTESTATTVPPLVVGGALVPLGFDRIPVSNLTPLIVGEINALLASDSDPQDAKHGLLSGVHLDLNNQILEITDLPFSLIQTGDNISNKKKKKRLIASGSSNSASPTGNVVLLVAGSAIAQLFHGQSGIVIPPEFVNKTFKVILNSATEAELFQAIVDQAAHGHK